MFVLTAKISKSKLIAAFVLLIAAILMIVLLASDSGKHESDAPIGTSNDDRVAYLATFGWSVNASPYETQKVKIPDTADNRIFARYNELQKSQGFDLTDYAGQEIMRYVYEVLNYPEADHPVYATVLVANGRIIGGDITSSAVNGIMHGFKKPKAETSAQSPTQLTTEADESSEPTEAQE